MITFFRRILSSWLVLGLFALILVAFIITGVNLPGGGGIGSLGASSDAPAQVGRSSIPTQDVAQRTQAQFDAARRDDPSLTLASFVRGGGVEQTVDQMLNIRALERFANNDGIYASKRLVDGEILSIPAFRGPTGQFDRNTFLGILSQQKLTETGVRDDIAREKVASMLAVPVSAGTRVPVGIATPYAAALLETRQGLVAAVPNSAIPAGKPATDAEIQAFYKQNVARYTSLETRTIRFAHFDRAQFEGKVPPTEAEIATAYKANATKYAGKETRVLTQVIVPDQASANALAAKIKAGSSIEAAAKTVGSEATTLSAQDKAGYAGLSSAAIADAAFGTAQAMVTVPAKSGLGWHVVRVDKIYNIAGKTLADVRATLIADLTKSKTEAALAELVTKIEDAIADGSTFDDVVKAEGLSAVTTPAITATGTSPADPKYQLPADLAPVVRDAFQAEIDDDASVVSLTAGQSYTLYDLDRINPAAPRPIAEVSGIIKADIEVLRKSNAARVIASAIAAKANKGVPLAEAVRGAGINLPPARSILARRIDLIEAKAAAPPTLEMLFRIGKKQARLLESSDKNGWSVVYLETMITPTANTEPGLILTTQQQMARVIGDEYGIQFANAVKVSVGAKRNPAAIAKIKRDLTGARAQ